MKKIFLLIALFYSLNIGQVGWKTPVNTTVNSANTTQIDLFSNKDGNHLLVKQTNGNIVYYRLDASGTVNDALTTTLETGGNFPNIVGSNDKVYALYKIGSVITGKYSVNGGTSWTALPQTIPTSDNECNGVDAIYDPTQGVHIVWATRDYNSTGFETYYYRLNNNDQWVDNYTVTNYTTDEVGGFPTVSYSTNRVHVGYNTGTESMPMLNHGIAKNRDKVNSSWGIPQEVYNVGSDKSSIERIHAGATQLFDFYYRFDAGVLKLCEKHRSLTGTTWSNEYVVFTGGDLSENVSIANTLDGKINVVYMGNSSVIHTSYDGSTWVSTTLSSDWGYPRISSTSNDMFVMWHRQSWPMRYHQYDATPTAPLNFAGTSLNNHPKITWNAPVEPDVYSGGHIKVYRGYQEGGVTYWGLAATLAGNSTNWVDELVALVSPKFYHVDYCYKVTAVDIGSKESSATAPVWYSGEGIMWKTSNSENSEETMIKEYKLSQNYPNPFNPSTVISYQIPSKSFVILKVYDVLGNEVAVLVNEWKETGNYTTQFTTSGKQLTSGMYFYTLSAGKFNDTKKFILLK